MINNHIKQNQVSIEINVQDEFQTVKNKLQFLGILLPLVYNGNTLNLESENRQYTKIKAASFDSKGSWRQQTIRSYWFYLVKL